MDYCSDCGGKLEERYLEDEGMIPYCASCEAFKFPVFNVDVSVIIKNKEEDKILLIQQYGRKRNILVAGYVNKGESAEDAVRREVMEEVGLQVVDISYNRSEYYEKSNTLILNFTCRAADDAYKRIVKEVDEVSWFAIAESRLSIADGSLAERFLLSYLEGE